MKVLISARKEKKDWIFEIKDNGKGFDDQYKSKIFEIFNRLEGGDIPGTGIGLASCKKIVERHGGTMWAESEPGKGSSFYFSLPEKQVKDTD